MNKNNIIMHVIIWTITGLTIGIGMYLTKNPSCLWAFAFPVIFYALTPESSKDPIISISSKLKNND